MPETLTDAQKVLRNDTGKRIAVALEALASEVEPSTVIAPEYDATQTYAVGDLVMYRSVLYRCTAAITTPEEWTAAHWTATRVSDAYRQAVDQNVIDANLMALGLTGASVGDLVRVAAVDTNGKPTSWEHVSSSDVIRTCAKVDELGFVISGNTCISSVAAGQYVILRNSTISGKTDGLYTAANAIPANTPIDASYLSGPVAGGGLNDINSRIAMTIYNLTPETGFTMEAWGYCTATIYGKLAIISGGGIRGDAPSSTELLAFTLPSNIIFASNVFAGFADGVLGTIRAVVGTSYIVIRNPTTDILFFDLIATII